MTDYTKVFYKGKNPSRNCLFCQPNPGMEIIETENFRLLADTFPITPGHLMISSKDHYSSAGELPSYLHEEFFSLKITATEIVRKMGSGYILYEHGKAGSCHAHSSEEIHCEHFHLHCLPVSLCIHSKIAARFPGIKMKDFDALFENYKKNGSYLYFENSINEMVFYPAEEHEVPPHFLRTLICEALNKGGKAAWQEYTDLHCYLESRIMIANALAAEARYAVL